MLHMMQTVYANCEDCVCGALGKGFYIWAKRDAHLRIWYVWLVINRRRIWPLWPDPKLRPKLERGASAKITKLRLITEALAIHRGFGVLPKLWCFTQSSAFNQSRLFQIVNSSVNIDIYFTRKASVFFNCKCNGMQSLTKKKVVLCSNNW